MATDYFTTDHFKLLNKWKGQKRDDTNPEQNQAYDELKKAYFVTENWAQLVKERLYPEGHIDVRKRPTNQANNFFAYNWAKIYPSDDSPEELAYTVGINSDQEFVVKIDTVLVSDGSALRKKFEAIRGPFSNESPITAILPAAKGLAMSLAELVDWSVDTIRAFKLSYDDVVKQLGLDKQNGTIPPERPEPVLGKTRAPINRIYYGPPGTGKTFALQSLLKSDYTTMISAMSADEWRASQIATRMSSLTWWEVLAAALYDVGSPTDVAHLQHHPFVQTKVDANNRTTNIKQTLWSALQLHTVESSTTVKHKNRQSPGVFDKSADSKWNLSGDWKDGCADIITLVDEIKRGPTRNGESIRRYDFVTFHQSYGYEEFIEGLRPILDQESDQPPKYIINPGAFLRLCERARLDPHHPYAMVIDEVNRGNISKIFGELITLIETDKRAGCPNQLTVTLPYSGREFSIPSNVDILGSMNTADRSLALVDTALRRRFEFEVILPNPSLLGERVVTKDGVDIHLQSLLSIMNQRIEAIFDREHTIGHAYLLGLADIPIEVQFDGLKSIFVKKLLPLLEEYFFDDWQKIRLVLGDNQKANQDLCFIQEFDRAQDLESLFGADHDLALDGMRPRFQQNPAALDSPLAYVAIYEPAAASAKPI